MAGRNFGLTNIYLKLGFGLMLIGVLLFFLGLLLWWLRVDMGQWLMFLPYWLFSAGLVIYVIGRIAKVVAGLRSNP